MLIDALTAIDGVEFEAAWNDRTMANLGGVAVPVLSRVHLIANKRTVDLCKTLRMSSGSGRTASRRRRIRWRDSHEGAASINKVPRNT